jgi:hypothetical protein
LEHVDSAGGQLVVKDKMSQQKPLLVLAALAVFSCFSYAQAQKNSASVSITPASIDAKVQRGSSYTQLFTLTNSTSSRMRFRCSVADMGYDDNNNRLTGRAGTLPRSASLWIEFSPSEILVEPHRSGIVRVLVTVPATAAGGYYSVPVFEAIPVNEVAASASTPAQVITAKAAVGVQFNGLMMFTTLEAAEYNIEIMGGKITPPTASAELALQLDIRNRGNAHARVHGAFAILDGSRALAGRGTLNDLRYLPGQRKLLETSWAGELPPGKYTAVITLSYDRVGRDAATLAYELPLVVQ